MSQPMRAGFRPFGRSNQAPPLSPPSPIAEAEEGEGFAVADYMLPRGMVPSGQWANAQVAAFQNARPAPSAPPPHGSSARGMTPEQRAAFVAQRDADMAATRGAESYRLASTPERSSSITAASFPPVPALSFQRASVDSAHKMQPAADAQALEQDLQTPAVEDDQNDPFDAEPAPVASIEEAQVLPPPSPTTLAPPLSPVRPDSPATVRPASSRQASVALTATPRLVTAAAFPSDVEIEVRGQGADRVLTIRLRAAAI